MLNRDFIRPLELPLSESQIDQKITNLLSTFCETVNLAGYKVKPYSASSLKTLREFSFEKKQEILKSLVSYINVFVKTVENGHAITDQKSVIWALFKEMGWRPTSDLFHFITDDCVVEVYSHDFRQVFRNLKYFDFVTYNLGEVFSFEWTTLFERNNEIANKLSNFAVEILSGRISGTLTLDTGWHQLKEQFSEEKNTFWVNHKVLSPVFDQNTRSIAALVAISDAKHR